MKSNGLGLYIYGAGHYGQICRAWLERKGIPFRGFLISDGQAFPADADYPVFRLSEKKGDEAARVLVAVSPQYWDEIHANLSAAFPGRPVSVAYLSEEELHAMFRTLHPIEPGKMLLRSGPGDRWMWDCGTSLSRYYISKFLDSVCASLQGVRRVYEVGDNRYSRAYFPDAESEILDYGKGVDLTRSDTLPKERFDVFLCTQVFNFIYDVPAALLGARQVLKEGGRLICTVTGNISQVTEDMNLYGDYWRFTYLSIRMLVESVFGQENVQVIPFGNALACTSYLQGMVLEDLPKPELLDETDPWYSLVIGVTARKVSHA